MWQPSGVSSAPKRRFWFWATVAGLGVAAQATLVGGVVMAMRRADRSEADQEALRRMAVELYAAQGQRDLALDRLKRRDSGDSLADQEKLIEVGEKAVLEALSHLFSPMFLPCTFKVKNRGNFWTVEGIVLEGRGLSADAHFFAAEIVSAPFPAKYAAKSIIFDLYTYRRDKEGTLVMDRDPIPSDGGAYPIARLQ